MKAVWRGRVIAESEKTVEAGGYVYFPRESVRMDMLRSAPKTPSDDECPHGVQFYDVVDPVDGSVSQRAAWSYEAPKPAMRGVDHRLGFWKDVEVG